MKGSGDELETDNKASNNPQPAPRPKILRLRLPVGQKKSGSGGPTQGPNTSNDPGSWADFRLTSEITQKPFRSFVPSQSFVPNLYSRTTT
jgi:hypothetical protein